MVEYYWRVANSVAYRPVYQRFQCANAFKEAEKRYPTNKNLPGIPFEKEIKANDYG
jgi:hypothetical protein